MSEAPATGSQDWRLRMQFGPDWFTLSAGPEELNLNQLVAQVDRRIGREPRLLDSRQALIDMLVYFSNQATQRGATQAALRWALNELDGVSLATCYLSSYQGNPFKDTEQLFAFLQARMAPRHGSDQIEPKVEVRELPAGRALRVQVISDTGFRSGDQPSEDGEAPGAPKRALLQETVQYWLPVPGDTVTLVISFSTPNLAASEPLVAELDQMIQGLQLTTT